MKSNLYLHKPFNTRAISLAVFLLAACVQPILAQGFRVESESQRSIAATDSFVSLEGRFSIALPPSHNGFRPLSIGTPAGPARGDAYSWQMKEGSFTAGYVDMPEAGELADSADLFRGIRDGLVEWAGTQKGKLLNERQIEFEKHPGLELRLEFPEALLLQRFFRVSRRVYEVMLVLRGEQRTSETAAVKVLDSFKVLSDTEVATLLKAKAAAAEPAPLPQEPVVPRVGTDATDEGLLGKVKTVFEESEDLTGTWSVQGRKPNSLMYYNERGNLTKAEHYDYKGNLFEITVYGYIDGARVSSGKTIQHEYNPPPLVMPAPPDAAKAKSDPRYSNKFAFKYDEQKRLVEKLWFLSNGEVTSRHIYKYSGNQREQFGYSRDGSLNRHHLSLLNDKGVETEKTDFEIKTSSVRDKYSYAYEFDDKSNWIKRTVSKWVTKGGKSYYEPAYADYRKIVYY